MRSTENVSITIPPRLLRDAERVAIQEGRTKSELFREALRQYLGRRQWQEIRSYGSARAKGLGLRPGDVPRLIAEYRREQEQKKNKTRAPRRR